MSFKDAPLAFVDIETTGSNAQRDRITEIAIITWDHQTIKRWERLIDPGVGIPEFIQRLTGIGPDLLEGAPAFEDLAQELWQELEGKIFIAHNANFDYGFIKAAFKRLDMEFKAPVLIGETITAIAIPFMATVLMGILWKRVNYAGGMFGLLGGEEVAGVAGIFLSVPVLGRPPAAEAGGRSKK